MLKKLKAFCIAMLKVIFTFVLTLVIVSTLQNLYLRYLFESVEMAVSADKAYQIMGEPDGIDRHPTANETMWVYEKTFLSSPYILVIKNNTVIDKFELGSPQTSR